MMRYFYNLLLMMLAISPMISATQRQGSEFVDISWSPRQLRTGSPCLFRLEMREVPSAIRGKWQDRTIVFFPGPDQHLWYALAGVDVEAKPDAYTLALEATLRNGEVIQAARSIQVTKSKYKSEQIWVDARFVEPDADALQEIRADKETKTKAFAHTSPNPEWSGIFNAPVDSSISEGFGTRRIFNGKLSSLHRGLDYRSTEGTPVKTMNAGTVILARKLYYEGDCVIIDHGQQFLTIYMHLSRMDVSEGIHVSKGQQIGLSGASGRTTGPHLHIAVRWQGAYLDPAKLFELNLPELP